VNSAEYDVLHFVRRAVTRSRFHAGGLAAMGADALDLVDSRRHTAGRVR
jgi:hypothetical protein